MPQVALATFLSSCPDVITLGIRATLNDYPESEKKLLFHAERIFFPTPRFVEIFHAAGVPTFPNAVTYRYQRSRVLQQLLLQYLDWPHPRTRIYFGRQKAEISRDFSFPLLAMDPRNHPNTRHLVHGERELQEWKARYNPLIVQEYITWDEVLRLISVQSDCLGVQSRVVDEVVNPSFESASSDGPCREDLFRLHRDLTCAADLDDIAIVWGRKENRWFVLEMTRPPVRWRSADGVMDRHRIIAARIASGQFNRLTRSLPGS